GAPGVRSARYAGEHGNDGANVDLLLENLKDTPAPRTARFVCAMALTRPGREPLVVEGRAEGEILFERRGENGFGYDPVFLYGGKKTFAEMDEHDKNAVSHRHNAARALLAALEAE
ncbi:MAG: non-canonical purine NTP pyrophosphatase, partial [Candidatus Aphodomonas sp.]|nr:non-canonical purine NTP pyrophosphatase [Candidatus Aphodomonas sp.]